MGWLRKRAEVEAREPKKAFAFQPCPGCNYDFVTGEGRRYCSWYDCPYLPEGLKVFCPECNYNFATHEGNPHCGDPPTCEWAVHGYRNAGAARRFFKRSS